MAILDSRVIHNIIDDLPKGNCESDVRDINKDVNSIVVHQTDMVCNGDQQAWDVAELHTSPPRNWCGIGYHLLLTETGKILQTRNLKHRSAHAGNANDYSIGVVICGVHRKSDGDTNEEIIGRKQYKSLVWLLAHLQNKYPNIDNILAHADVSSKSCPNLHMDELKNDVKKKRFQIVIVNWVFFAFLAYFIVNLGRRLLYY